MQKIPKTKIYTQKELEKTKTKTTKPQMNQLAEV